MIFAFRRKVPTGELNTHREFVANRFCRFGRFLMLPLMAAAWLFGQAAPVHAATVRLAWDSVPGVKIYKLYYGTASRAYNKSVSVTNYTEATVSNLLGGTRYYFAVTAVATNYLESDYSAEVVYTPSGNPAGPSQPTFLISVSPTTRQATLSGTATPGQNLYIFTASSPRGPWAELTRLTVPSDGIIRYTDPTPANSGRRFYRLSDTAAMAGLPVLRLKITPDQQAVLTATAPLNKVYSVQISTTPTGPWSDLGSVTAAANGTLSFIDPTKTLPGSRFYRLAEK